MNSGSAEPNMSSCRSQHIQSTVSESIKNFEEPCDDDDTYPRPNKEGVIKNPFSDYDNQRTTAASQRPSSKAVSGAYQLLNIPRGTSEKAVFEAADRRMDDAEAAWIAVMTDQGYTVIPSMNRFWRQAAKAAVKGRMVLLNPFVKSPSDDDEEESEPYDKPSKEATIDAYDLLGVTRKTNKREAFDAAEDRMNEAEEAWVMIMTDLGYKVVPSSSHHFSTMFRHKSVYKREQPPSRGFLIAKTGKKKQ